MVLNLNGIQLIVFLELLHFTTTEETHINVNFIWYTSLEILHKFSFEADVNNDNLSVVRIIHIQRLSCILHVLLVIFCINQVLPGIGWDNLRNKEAGMVATYNFSLCKTTDDGRKLITDSVFTIPLKVR